MIAPICAGDLLMVTPAASKALILSVAVPLPPAMMAPAWPIRRPGGAVKPACQTTPPQNLLKKQGPLLMTPYMNSVSAVQAEHNAGDTLGVMHTHREMSV